VTIDDLMMRGKISSCSNRSTLKLQQHRYALAIKFVGGATRPHPKDGLGETPLWPKIRAWWWCLEPRPEVWTRGQRWTK